MSSWIVDAARRQAGKQVAVSALVVAVLGALLPANWDYVREYFRGAHPVSTQEPITAAPSTRGWICVRADKLHTTGLRMITVRKKHGIERSRSVSTEYFVAEVGNRLLLVKGVPGQGAQLEGALAPPDSEAMSRLLDKPDTRAAPERRIALKERRLRERRRRRHLSGVIGIRAPSWTVLLCLIAPRRPTLPRAAREQLEKRTWATGLDEAVGFVGLSRVLALARVNHVDLTASRGERACVLAPHAKQQKFSGISEVEADASTIGPSVLANLVPNEIGLVLETPRCQHLESVRQQSVGHPEVQMSSVAAHLGNGQGTDLGQ